LETPYGQAVSDWSTSGGVLTLRVTVPAGASALVKVPGTSVSAPAQAVPFGSGGGAVSYYLPSGSYSFTAA
jgi:alpha-L-rhamnosidase